ncbi:hypothetical protein WA158_001358 [Blastocystis sp. Blastoise]
MYNVLIIELTKEEKEQFRIAIRDRCIFEKLVLDQQMILSESNVTYDQFNFALKYFKTVNYDYCTEERNVNGICAYPLCNKTVRISKSKFFISPDDHKLYDSQKTRRFCCEKCKTAYFYIRSQLSNESLYLREEKDIPKFDIIDMSDHICGHFEKKE